MKKQILTLSTVLAALLSLKSYGEIDLSKLVEVNAENKQRCVEFFTVNNKMYCSTTMLTAPQQNPDAAKYEKLNVVFDDRKWVTGWASQNGAMSSVEYMPAGQKIESWNELVTSQFQPDLQRRLSPGEYVQRIKQTLTDRGYNPVFTIHQQTPQDVIFEFKIAQPAAEAQNELQRVMANDKGLYILHYVIRKADMPAENRDAWLKNLKAATFK